MTHLTTGRRARVLAAGAAMALSAGGIYAPAAAIQPDGPRIELPTERRLDVAPSLLVFAHFRACLAKPWTPLTADGTLHMLVRPEGTKYTTTARSTLTTGTGNVGSATDESAQANHLEIATALPTRTTGGGINFAGNYLRSKNVMGAAFGGDFVVGVATKLTTPVVSHRYLDCNSINGYILSQANNSGGLNKVNSIVADTVAPYGVEVSATDGVFHGFVDSRIGTAHDLRIDGTVAGTETVSSAALGATSYLYVSADGPSTSYSMYGAIYEIIIIASPTTRDILGMAAYFAARNTAGIYV